jgi:hypothetical protein
MKGPPNEEEGTEISPEDQPQAAEAR